MVGFARRPFDCAIGPGCIHAGLMGIAHRLGTLQPGTRKKKVSPSIS